MRGREGVMIGPSVQPCFQPYKTSSPFYGNAYIE
jgi:hypothetical protein